LRIFIYKRPNLRQNRSVPQDPSCREAIGASPARAFVPRSYRSKLSRPSKLRVCARNKGAAMQLQKNRAWCCKSLCAMPQEA
jgi:hypothetical protein